MDLQQKKDEPKRENTPDGGTKVMSPAKKESILFGSKLILVCYLLMSLIEGSFNLLFYSEFYDFKTYSSQLMSNKDFLRDSLITLLGFLQLPFLIVVLQAMRRKDLNKYLTAKKLLCIPWALEFFKTTIRVLQGLDQQNDDGDSWTRLVLACNCCPALTCAYFFVRDKTIRECFQDEKSESSNNNSERKANGAEEEEEETSVHLDKLNSYGYVIYKYWMLISGVWTIQWLFYIFTESLQIQEDNLEEIDFTAIIMSLTALGVLALLIWHTLNCFLVFEAIRRKNLKKIESSIKYMEIYSIATIVLIFFGFGNETFRNFIKKEDPSMFDVNSMTWTLIVIVCLLVWRVYYHFIYMYGVYKVREALKAHQKSKHSQ